MRLKKFLKCRNKVYLPKADTLGYRRTAIKAVPTQKNSLTIPVRVGGVQTVIARDEVLK